MKSLITLTGLLAALPVVQCHYVFVRMALNDKWFEPLKYIRNRTSTYEDTYNSTITYADMSTRVEGYHREYADPTYPLDSPESLRCGRGSSAYARSTETLTVKAGDKVTFAAVILPPRYWTSATFACTGVCGSPGPFHGGPVQAYLSRVANGTKIGEYDGSGRWVKFASVGLNPKNESVDWLGSSQYRKEAINPSFVIPAKTPPGTYLLRVESTYPRALPNVAQFYTGCAHVEIKGSGGGHLPLGVKIPEDFPPNHPGLRISQAMEDLKKVDATYEYPGGELWNGS